MSDLTISNRQFRYSDDFEVYDIIYSDYCLYKYIIDYKYQTTSFYNSYIPEIKTVPAVIQMDMFNPDNSINKFNKLLVLK